MHRHAIDVEHYNIGVIVRTNDEVTNLIFSLQQLGIPASEEGGNPLTDALAVQLVLSLLRLADHPGDTVARFHVAHSPLGRIVGFEVEDYDDEAAVHRALPCGRRPRSNRRPPGSTRRSFRAQNLGSRTPTVASRV